MNAIVPLVPLTNRKLKRGYIREKKKVEHLLVDIECSFEYALFNAPREISYRDLYDYFLPIWHEICEKLLLTYNFIYIAIDLHHFPRQYRPRV